MLIEAGLVKELVVRKDDPARIWSLFCEAGLDAARLATLNPVTDPTTPYSRVVLWGEPACEMMLARWTPDRVCAPHDHGSSAGWVFYFEHEFVEHAYAWRGGTLTRVAAHTHRPGSYTEVRHHEIHSCMAIGSGLSLHVYFPRIEKMRVHDLEGRRTLVVADDCGAWIPSRPEQVIEATPWAR